MILCCGEALIDMIPEPTVSGKSGFVPHTGGAVFNTAIALGRLGTTVGLLTGLSTDLFGQQLLDALKSTNVDTGQLILSDRPTTLAFVRLVEGQASYSFFDENSAGRMLMPADMPQSTASASALFFGGISLACEPGAEAYADLLERESDGHAIMLDPNIRAGFIANESRYRARLERMLSLADIVKVSDEDLNWIIEGSASLQDKARTVLGLGPALVVLTCGGDGATGYLRSGDMVQVPARTAVVRDTVGAGDSFNAGILAQFQQKGLLSKDRLATLTVDAVREALQHAARVAAITVSRVGADPPWANEMADLTQ